MMLDPKPTYAYVVSQLRAKHPDLSYIHVIEPSDELVATTAGERPSNDFIREIWGNRKLISAGGYSDTLGRGPQMAEEKGDLIAYGRAYISNVNPRLSMSRLC
jgi:NADPH2 dehydrogenase